jgi:hypothetical protein
MTSGQETLGCKMPHVLPAQEHNRSHSQNASNGGRLHKSTDMSLTSRFHKIVVRE